MTRAIARQFSDGRLHLQDGPIDLIIEAFGSADDVTRAYRAAERRFVGILDELCDELPSLRAEVGTAPRPKGVVARRMFDAVQPHAARSFITPMAAVAGSVAEEVLGAMTAAALLSRAYVNNGGDIALHLAPGEAFAVGMISRPDQPSLFGKAEIAAADGVRGVATSGRHGRSFSLGIADAVTVLAATAAAADAAATVIANAVDLPGHAAIARQPANHFDPQSDLGERLVTIAVGPLTEIETARALSAGLDVAENLREAGLIVGAALHLNGKTRLTAANCGAPLRRIEESEVFHAVG
jgi:ApbE superfamily uncharacterized protein (UPF0280 family)